MAEIGTVLLAVDFREELMARIEAAFAPARVIRASMDDDAAIAAAMAEADVAVLPSDLDDRILAGPHLRWVHCCHSGLNKSARPEVFARNITVTGSAGRSAPSLAEHAFFFMLALTYDAYGLKAAQADRDWGVFARRYPASRGLNGQTVIESIHPLHRPERDVLRVDVAVGIEDPLHITIVDNLEVGEERDQGLAAAPNYLAGTPFMASVQSVPF